MGEVELTLGQRIAVQRRLRGLTQEGLAQRLHRSASWVTKIERGVRRVDSMSVLLELSRALGVPLEQLTGRSGPPMESPTHAAGVAELRRLLDRPSRFAPVDPLAPLSGRQLAVEAAALRRAYNAGRNVSAVVPELTALIEVAQTAVTADNADREAFASLANLYRLSSLELRQLGDLGRARLAVDRALAAAERSGDDLLLGSVAATMTVQLMVQGDPEDGVAVALDTREHLRRTVDGSQAGLVVGGALCLYAAQAAARAGDPAEARALLKAASGLAEEVGADVERYCLIFGPTNLAIQTAGIMVDLDRPTEAIRCAEPVRPNRLGSSNRSGYHWLHLARAYGMTSAVDAAVDSLTHALRAAPELVRHDPLARDLVLGMLRRRRVVGEQLRRLAHAMNITP